MCARLLACPLCSQPGFATLDALRAGLVSVATRPLACPVCDETLLGIDKLTIHLFGHTIGGHERSEPPQREDGDACAATIFPRTWNVRGTQTSTAPELSPENLARNHEKVAFPSTLGALNVDVNSVNRRAQNPRRSRKSQADVTFAISDSSQRREFLAPNSNQRREFLAPNSNHRREFSANDLGQRREFSATDSSQRRQFSAPDSPTNFERRQFSSPKIIHDSTGIPSIQDYGPSVILLDDSPSANHRSQSARDSRDPNETSSYQKNIAKKFAHVAEKVDTQFTDTWIENLLHDDEGGKCFAADCKSTPREEKNEFSIKSQGILGLSDGEKKHRPSTSSGDVDADGQTIEPLSRRQNSNDSINHRAQEMFEENPQSDSSFKGLLPQWKAFRLLATKDKTERCDICGIHFPDANFLVLHKQLAHLISEKDANAAPDELLKNCPCHLCTKVFKTRGTLMVHMRVAHMGYNLGFLSKDKEAESVCSENGFNCPTCGKNFKKEQHVTQHLKTHEGKQWECDVCSKMFTTKYFLKKHKRLHSGEMPYKCTICEKTFTFQQSYHKHRLYHKDDKPHTCATCGRSFKELSTLHNHERIHTGEKPFVCETCGKCFRQRVSYLVHRRIHTGVMPYKCTVCGKSFRYKVSQRTHKCPAQPDETSMPPEAASTLNPELPSSSRIDCPTIPKTDIFFPRETQSDVAGVEGNKFILIVNTQGQPILTKETEASVGYVDDEIRVEPSNGGSKTRREDGNVLWNDCLPDENVAKEAEKLPTGDPSDFFALVMSPMENDLSSPSTEMEHLRLSSPQSDEKKQNETRRNPDENSGLQRDLNNAIDGIFHENCAVNGPLETINEESLKQLLYGIEGKD